MLAALTSRLHKLIHLPFFHRARALSAWEAIGWWERRRPAFNLVVGATGVLTCVVSLVSLAVAGHFSGGIGELPDPPILPFLAIGAFAVMANVCYTGGWITELLVRWLWDDDGPRLASAGFTLGLVFSVLVTLAPAVFVVGVACLQVLIAAGGR